MIVTPVKKLSLLIALLVFSLLGSVPVFAATTTEIAPVLETTAVGEVEADPDIAYLNLQVRTEESDSELAQQNNAKAAQQAMAVLRENGLKAEDINTRYYSSYSYTKIIRPLDTVTAEKPLLPMPEPEKGEEVTIYVTESSIKATVRDLSQVGSLLTALAKIPTIHVNSIQYAIENIMQYKKAAITQAITQAKETIEYTAAALGVELGGLRSVRVDFINYYYGPVYAKEMAYGGSADGMGMPQPQSPEKIKVQATAYLVYTAK